MSAPVVVFTLPLSACLPQNRTNHRAPWAYQADRKRVATLMRLQSIPARAPLPGRPRVVCTRYSSVEPDKYSDWPKMAIDVLCMPTSRAPNRLGFLRDDRPKDAEIIQQWEYAPPKKGRCVIEVFSS